MGVRKPPYLLLHTETEQDLERCRGLRKCGNPETLPLPSSQVLPRSLYLVLQTTRCGLPGSVTRNTQGNDVEKNIGSTTRVVGLSVPTPVYFFSQNSFVPSLRTNHLWIKLVCVFPYPRPSNPYVSIQKRRTHKKK